MTTVRSFLAGHPERAGAVAVAFVVALSIAWYLGSPLFIRTYTNETFPAAPAATAAPASTSGATNGSFNYEVPAGMTVADYKSVVVWCRAFGVLITWADLT